MKKLYLFLLMLCMANTGVYAQSEKVDVEIHAGGNASIYVDGNKTAAGKGTVTVKLTLGKHTAKATLPDCNPVTKSFTVTSSYASRVVNLGMPQPKPRTDADVTFVVDNNALIFIDEESVPAGYGKAIVTLPFGTHKVTAKLASHESTEKIIEVNAQTPSDPIKLEAPKEQQGEIAIKSTPAEANVQIDDVWQGYTTPATANLKAGVHKIAISKQGYDPVAEYILVEPNKQVSFEQTLTKQTKSSTTASSTAGSEEKELTRAQLKRREYYDYSNKFRLNYFGIGLGIGTAFTAEISALDIRYGLVEIRPLLWGMNYSFIYGLPHHKLEYIVNPTTVGTDYSGKNEYTMAYPSRGIQWYYTPMVRLFIPCTAKSAVTLGIGPQFSWTKVKYSEKRGTLPMYSPYKFDSGSFPSDGYQYDGAWFACELSYLVSSGSFDWNIYVRYQDGVALGFNIRFGYGR